MLCNFAKIGDDEIKAIQAMEKEIGQTLVAFSCMKSEPASLTQDQLEKLQTLEKKLNLSLVAVG